MADHEKLLRELKFLGIDESMVELLALLPLIQVAWADGTVQEQERELILEIATTRYHLTDDSRTMLEDWLSHPPSERYLARGRRALLALSSERADFDIDQASLNDVVEFSKSVAKAAGGFMGFRTVDLDEQLALEDIADALEIQGSSVDSSLLDEDEDVDDENTDIVSAEEMNLIRENATIARSPTQRTLTGNELADLVHHGSEPTNFPMDDSGLSIGRSAVNLVQLPHDGQISRVHARIVHVDGRFYVEDNDTTNGTWVNGERVSKRRLYGGEQIRTGGAHFTFMVR